MIDRILDKLSAADKSAPVCIVTNAKFFEAFDGWAKASPYKRRITLLDDGTTSNENRLGAIRDLELTIKEGSIDDDVLVIAGDNLFEFGLNRFLEFARSRPDGVSVALYDIGDLEQAKNFGVLKINGNNRVVDFEEKPASPKSTLVSTGIYYFPKNKLPFIKEYVKMQSKLDAPGYYISWLSRTDKVYGFSFAEKWYDIGTLESYTKADREYKDKEGFPFGFRDFVSFKSQ
jgi:glucose-1-phosphate thymidylyltransferase